MVILPDDVYDGCCVRECLASVGQDVGLQLALIGVEAQSCSVKLLDANDRVRGDVTGAALDSSVLHVKCCLAFAKRLRRIAMCGWVERLSGWDFVQEARTARRQVRVQERRSGRHALERRIPNCGRTRDRAGRASGAGHRGVADGGSR